MKWPRAILRWMDGFAKGASVLLAALAKTSVASVPAFAAPYLLSIQTGYWIPVALVVAPSAAYLRRRVDNSKLDQVHELLDQIRDATFKNETFELEQHARVTLFRYKWFTWREWPFFGGWLIPIERSGLSTRSTRAIFRAHDDGEMCGGVAGRTWAKRSTVSIAELPNVKRQGSEENVRRYAEASFVTEKMLRRKLPQAQALYGIPVELNGNRWGVIVIDSVNPKINTKAADKIFKNLNPTLTSYLKGL